MENMADKFKELIDLKTNSNVTIYYNDTVEDIINRENYISGLVRCVNIKHDIFDLNNLNIKEYEKDITQQLSQGFTSFFDENDDIIGPNLCMYGGEYSHAIYGIIKIKNEKYYMFS